MRLLILIVNLIGEVPVKLMKHTSRYNCGGVSRVSQEVLTYSVIYSVNGF